MLSSKTVEKISSKVYEKFKIDIKKNKPTNKVREIGVLKRRRQKANLYKGKTGKYYFKIGIMNYKIPPEIDGENITIKDVEGILKASR